MASEKPERNAGKQGGRSGRGGRRGRGRGSGRQRGGRGGERVGENDKPQHGNKISVTNESALSNLKNPREAISKPNEGGASDGQASMSNSVKVRGRGKRTPQGRKKSQPANQKKQDDDKPNQSDEDTPRSTSNPDQPTENAFKPTTNCSSGPNVANQPNEARRPASGKRRARGHGRRSDNENNTCEANQQLQASSAARPALHGDDGANKPEATKSPAQVKSKSNQSIVAKEVEEHSYTGAEGTKNGLQNNPLDGQKESTQLEDGGRVESGNVDAAVEQMKPTQAIHKEAEPRAVDEELDQRRQAEVEFVGCAYSSEEAWCDDTASDPIKVHRRLSLPCPNTDDQIVSLILTLSMTRGYPASEPLHISFALEKGPTHLWNAASDAAPVLVEACRQVAMEMVGDEAIFAVLSYADEWVQDHWPTYCKPHQQANHEENSPARGRTSKKGPLLLGRRLIYSHHIISKIKRGNMRDLGSHYQLTGYVKIGWPGIIIIEGLEEHCQYFYDDIKVWAWKYLVVRGEQQEKVGVGESIDSLRRFSCFQEVSDMSVVADHCRDVGLEALFKTSMRVYDNNESGVSSSNDPSDDGTPYGTLVWVDHMTDGKAYRKWLRKTSADTNVFLMIKQCFPNHDFTKRPTILVAVLGEMESIQDFMKRWRTSRVDVDSKGKACLERKMKVLHEGEMENDVINALDWDSASADSSLNLSREQLINLIQKFGDSEWLASTESLLSVS